MYAIIVDGGRQYKVTPGQRLDIDLRQSAEIGGTIEFTDVLAIGTDDGLQVGTPKVAGAKVTAKVLSEVKGPKIYIQKFRRRKDYRRRTGHRQTYTRIEVSDIQVADAAATE
ncbi:MAG: 50S ribosomal protein L21 [Planctomycetota bacterium]|nr:MAG: 50S ribosomal protein L21 [Planctomycetota bacterium]